MHSKKLPWWQSDDQYTVDEPVPAALREHAGPFGVALVKAWENGTTSSGWGLKNKQGQPSFMPRYTGGKFAEAPVLRGYDKNLWVFAFVMRSMRLICVDIDGKNGGLEHARRLGALPRTLAETSKSGTGYHLFYSVDEDWDVETGYALLSDRIGIEQGVDIRATGCVYHHTQQRWNQEEIAPLPDYLIELLQHREQKAVAATNRIAEILNTEDNMEIIMMQAQLEADLAKPIPDGKRNNTLFAIGQQMKQAQINGWEDKVHARALDIGLSMPEANKLIRNLQTYS